MKLAPPLPEWVTLGESVDWLNANTPLEWTWRRVLETLKAQYPETLHVVPPPGLHLAKPDQYGHLDNVTWQYPHLVQVSQAGEYLRQLLLGDSLETATGITGALVAPPRVLAGYSDWPHTGQRPSIIPA